MQTVACCIQARRRRVGLLMSGSWETCSTLRAVSESASAGLLDRPRDPFKHTNDGSGQQSQQQQGWNRGDGPLKHEYHHRPEGHIDICDGDAHGRKCIAGKAAGHVSHAGLSWRQQCEIEDSADREEARNEHDQKNKANDSQVLGEIPPVHECGRIVTPRGISCQAEHSWRLHKSQHKKVC